MIKNFKESNYFLHMVNKKKADIESEYDRIKEICINIVDDINSLNVKKHFSENLNEKYTKYDKDYISEIAFKKWCLVYLIIAKFSHHHIQVMGLRVAADSCTYCSYYNADGDCHHDCPIDLAGKNCNMYNSIWYMVDKYTRQPIFNYVDRTQAFNAAETIVDICYNDMRKGINQ